MIMSSTMIQFETDLGVDIEIDLSHLLSQDSRLNSQDSCSPRTSAQPEWDELELYTCWKEQTAGRHGGGSPAPFVPHSQRQYDGENSFEYCEQLAVR